MFCTLYKEQNTRCRARAESSACTRVASRGGSPVPPAPPAPSSRRSPELRVARRDRAPARQGLEARHSARHRRRRVRARRRRRRSAHPAADGALQAARRRGCPRRETTKRQLVIAALERYLDQTESVVTILYGVTGEGLGHAMRSRVIAEHLRRARSQREARRVGARVRLPARYFDDVEEIPGSRSRIPRSGSARLRTVARNGRAARARDPRLGRTVPAADLRVSARCLHQRLRLVLARVRQAVRSPVISLDHQHVIDRCEHARPARPHATSRSRARSCARSCRVAPTTSSRRSTATSAATSAEHDHARRTDPPPRGARAEPTTGDHVLVYQTADARARRAATRVPEPAFVVYGCGSGWSAHGNVTFRGSTRPRFSRTSRPRAR